MAYSIYTTEAIVCKSRGVREHDRMLLLFTEGAGMVYARASGARKDISKLRYALQDFSLARVSLVHGKHGWRVTGAEPIDNFYFSGHSREGRAAVMRGIRFLRRFIQGEEVHQQLFLMIRDSFNYFSLITEEDMVAEKIFSLRVLFELGYVSEDSTVHEIINAPTLEGALDAFSTRSPVTLGAIDLVIEEALDASQL